MIVLVWHILLIATMVQVYQKLPELFPVAMVVAVVLYCLPIIVDAIRSSFHPWMLIDLALVGMGFAVWSMFHNHGDAVPMMHNWVACYAADGATTVYYGPPANAPNPCNAQAPLGP